MSLEDRRESVSSVGNMPATKTLGNERSFLKDNASEIAGRLPKTLSPEIVRIDSPGEDVSFTDYIVSSEVREDGTYIESIELVSTQENQEGESLPENGGKFMSRRVRPFAKKLAPFAIAASLFGIWGFNKSSGASGEGNNSTPIAATSTTTNLEATSTGAIASEDSVDVSLLRTKEIKTGGGAGDVKVFYNEQGSPVMCLFSDGQKIYLDQEKVAEAKRKAIANKSYEFLDVAVVETDYEYRSGLHKSDPSRAPIPISISTDEEHPILKELPEDVMSEEELVKKNVRIVQGKDVKLYIRESAFNKGEALEAMNPEFSSEDIDGEKIKGQKSLVIVVADTFALFRQLLDNPNDPSSMLLPEFPQSLIHDYEGLEKGRYKKELSRLQVELKKAALGKNLKDKQEIESSILMLKPMLSALEQGKVSVQELIAGTLENDFYFDFPEEVEKIRKIGGRFIAAGQRENFIYVLTNNFFANAKYGLFINPDGELYINQQISTYGGSHGAVPNSYYLSFPSVQDYLAPGLTIGEVMEHETYHFFLNANKRINGEDETNMHALWNIKDASSRWKNSGYEDSSQYSFIFSIPEWLAEGYVGG